MKTLQSWVRFDYMAYRAVTSCKDRYKEKKISPSDCVNFPLSLYVVSSNLLSVVGVCKVLTVKKMTRLMVRTLISLVHSLLIAGVVSVRLDQQTESMGFQGASDRKIKG